MKSPLQVSAEGSPLLGHKVPYPKGYDKSLLFPISRSKQRQAMALPADLNMQGFDQWNAYELSWMNLKGKPVRACASFSVPAHSAFLAESKSVKLYLNSLNQERFENTSQVADLIGRDLSAVCQSEVNVSINPVFLSKISPLTEPGYYCLDELDISVNTYKPNPNLLKLESEPNIEEHSNKQHEDRVLSHLFKSHCLVTGQPDWGSIYIDYLGPKISRESILAYLISYQNHAGFSENCIEQIFADISRFAQAEKLLVFGRFTRRGGIEINPYRANFAAQNLNLGAELPNNRLIYQ